MNVAELRDRYYDLAVASCEWRAIGIADPDAMANECFGILDPTKEQGLRHLFAAIDKVVTASYQRYAATQSLLDKLRSGATLTGPARGKRSPADDFLDALSRLKQSDRSLLQFQFWDELNDAEMAQVLRLGEAEIRDRLATAGVRYLAKLARTHPEVALSDVGDAVRSIKPGIHSRYPSRPDSTN